MHENPKLTIAIDGPSGSGKSSVSKEVARHFGLAYLDTGAMYRAATYRVLELGIDLNDAEAIAKAVKEMPLVFGTNINEEEIMMGSTDIREEIRSERISSAVSAVASVPAVREYLIGLQRWTIDHAVNGMVAEGRDITTVVAHHAHGRPRPHVPQGDRQGRPADRLRGGAHGSPRPGELREVRRFG